MSDESQEVEHVEEVAEEVAEEVTEEVGEDSEGEFSEDGESVQAESEEELKEEIEEAIEDGASEEEVKSMIREYELKVNGKVVTKKIDLNDEDALKRELQMAGAGRNAMQRAAELERAYENALEELKTNPFAVLEQLGLDPDQLSEHRLQSKIEEMQKSPEQVERERIQQELTEAREEAARLKQEKQTRERESVIKQHEEHLTKEISDALDSHSTLPSTQKTFAEIADIMFQGAESGYNVTAQEAASILEREKERELQEFFKDRPLDVIEKYLGKSNIKRMREERVKRAKKTSNIKNLKSVTKPKNEESTSTKKIRSKDYFNDL